MPSLRLDGARSRVEDWHADSEGYAPPMPTERSRRASPPGLASRARLAWRPADPLRVGRDGEMCKLRAAFDATPVGGRSNGRHVTSDKVSYVWSGLPCGLSCGPAFGGFSTLSAARCSGASGVIRVHAAGRRLDRRHRSPRHGGGRRPAQMTSLKFARCGERVEAESPN